MFIVWFFFPFQVQHAMCIDTGYPITQLRVDGGMTVNNLVMQMQADFIGQPVGTY